MSLFETAPAALPGTVPSPDLPGDVPPIDATTVFWAAQSLISVHGDAAPLIAAEKAERLEREGKSVLADAFEQVRGAALELLQLQVPLAGAVIH